MNKLTKIVILIMLVIIAIYIFTGIYNINNPDINIDGDNANSGDIIEIGEGLTAEDYLANLEFELASGENEVVLTLLGSGERSSTKYIFENDALSQIIVEEEVFSGDELEVMYEELKNDATLSQAYSSIEISGDKIIMILKQEYVDLFAGKTKEDLYREIEKSMEN